MSRHAYGKAISMVVMGLLIGVTVWGEYAAGRMLALNVAAGLASWLLLPLMPRRPVWVTLALDVLAIFSPAATPAATLGTLRVASRRAFRVAVAVGAVGVAAHAARWLVQPIAGLPYGWWLVLVVVAHAALVGWGTAGRIRAALIASLRERAERAEAEQGRRVAEARALERRRIAGEMHDVLAHRLSLLATYAGALEYRPDAPPEKLAKAAGVIRSGVHQALNELRDVLTVLREDDADGDGDGNGGNGGGGAQGPQPVLADLPSLLDEVRDCGTPVELDDRTVTPEALPPTLSRTVYRVVQEGLTNARKHAPGQRVQVTLVGTPGERLTIELRNPLDDGGAPVLAIPGSGTGLIGLTERVRLAGGLIEHRTGHAEFLLQASLPFPSALIDASPAGR